jgi:hypothetical protein
MINDAKQYIISIAVSKSFVFWDITLEGQLNAGFLLGLFFNPEVGGDILL